MKKVLAVLAVVLVVCAAGAAFAQQNGKPRLDQRRGPQAMQNMPRPMPFNECECRCGHHNRMTPPAPFGFKPADGKGKNFGPRFDGPEIPGHFGHMGMMFAPDMPEEIRAKVVEAAKLKIDLDAALSQKPIDKAKALEIFGQIQKAEQEIEAWKFGKKIERIEAFRTQQELNRKMPPAQKPEAPAPEPKAE